MRTRTPARGPAFTGLGLGTAQLGNLGGVVDDADAAGALDAARDSGVRYFDTAPHYGLGLAERRPGAALARRPRAEYVVSTEVGRLLIHSPRTAHRQDDGGFAVPAAYRRVLDFGRDGIPRSLDGSLRRLGLDHVDVVYLHDPDAHWRQAAGTGVDTLVAPRDRGVVKAVGVGMNQTAMPAGSVRRCDVDLVMVAGRHTLPDHSARDALLALARERGAGVVAAAVHNSGLPATDRPTAGATYGYRPASRALTDRAAAIAAVCARHGVTPPEAAVAHPLWDPAVVSVVTGARDTAQSAGSARRVTADVPDALWAEPAGLGLVPGLDPVHRTTGRRA
ncbi:aldo/keto reductase [Streptomyces sp. CRN 30]|uniref:aldo/keto reductase n=1 Tax=Streptomyces sp. CRN 30 TaxID=3075613 RepID=UPI002A7F7DD5|nr:aldo/keto reductase [Streptomyces sp. CRN 30]